MRTIYKYPIETTDTQIVMMPQQAKILTVQVQHGRPCLWAEVNTIFAPERVVIETYGTGHQILRGKREYIGTYQLYGGDLIFHVYRRHVEDVD